MAKITNPTKVSSKHEQDKIEQEAANRAFDEMLSDIPDEAARRELRRRYEEIKRKLKEKAIAEARKLAKRLLKRLLELFSSGAGRLAGRMFWFWEQCGQLGLAIGSWIADAADKARNDKAIGWFNNASLDELRGLSPGTFTHLIDTEIVIVDKAGNPVDTEYTLKFKQSLGNNLEIHGATGSDGYDHKNVEDNGRDWPYDLDSVEIDVSDINRLKYFGDYGVKGRICIAGSLIYFRYVIKAIVAEKEEDGGWFFYFFGQSSKPPNYSQGAEFALGDQAGSSYFVIHPPGKLASGTVLAGLKPASSFAVEFLKTENPEVKIVQLSSLNLELDPFEMGHLNTAESKISIDPKQKSIGLLIWIPESSI